MNMDGFSFDNYDIDRYLEELNYIEDGRELAKYDKAYRYFKLAKSAYEMKLSFKDLEEKMYNSKNVIDGAIRVIEHYSLKNGLDTEYTRLAMYLMALSNTEASNEAKRGLIRKELAKYALENDITCYLMKENLELFDECYNEVIGRKKSL